MTQDPSTRKNSEPPLRADRPDRPQGPGVAARQRSLAELRSLGYSQVPQAAPLVRGHSVSAAQAVMGSGVLGPLWRRAQEAQSCLAQLRSVLPPALFALVESGPLENGQWTLLVGHSAGAAKIRQWLPALAAHVRSKGWPVEQIVVKVRPK